MARGKLISEALLQGRDDIIDLVSNNEDGKTIQLQGKRKIKALMKQLFKHHKNIDIIKVSANYNNSCTGVDQSPTFDRS